TAGLQPGELIIIAGRPGMGKTALAINVGYHAADKIRQGVAIFSLEMSKIQLGMRLLGMCAGINGSKLRTGHLSHSDWERLTEAADHLSELPIFIDDSSALSVLEIKAKCRRLRRKNDLALIIVDYLQLIQGRKSAESRQIEISEISRGLKALAKDMDVPVIAVSQLNRRVEERGNKRPMLSDLRESGAIEQDADIIMFIYRDEVYNPNTDQKNIAEITIAKHRNGDTGKFNLIYEKEFTRFRDYSLHDEFQ
ncbi:MAG TPA: replicative DNA helicase, partial [Desulfobacteraceae bacterium]|nr:replicative DNA helicase [Desulfobacteraceae bacterium]